MRIGRTFLAAVLWAAACSAAHAANGTAVELVLTPGTRMRVSTPAGTVDILAGTGIERTYEWNGCSLKSRMTVRTSRWYGALGVYDPAGRIFPSLPWERCKGLSRTVVAESQIHFADLESANFWVQRFCRHRGAEGAWSSDGLVACWSITPVREQLAMDVRQVCIGGRFPSALAGANDSALLLANAATPARTRLPCVAVDAAVAVETWKSWQAHWTPQKR